MTETITAETWRNKSYQGNLCGILGCLDNDTLTACSYCSLSYCESHIDMHESICVNDINKNKYKEIYDKEIEMYRERDDGHIDDISDERRDELREEIWNELQSLYELTDYHEMYVTGSWVRGEAIYGMSDLDIVVVVDPLDAEGKIGGTQDHFKSEFSKDRFDDDLWLFVDLWIESGPPNDGVIL